MSALHLLALYTFEESNLQTVRGGMNEYVLFNLIIQNREFSAIQLLYFQLLKLS